MASKDFAILDIQNDNDELHFQDFGLSGNSNQGSSQTHVFTDFPDSPSHQNDREKLLGEYQDDEEATPKPSNKSQSFWSFEYYQQYFDVDSKQVGDRIMWSMVPKPGVNYLEVHIRPKPDLYGPFWVCLTLVFAAAIAGNVSNYLQTQGDQSQHWRYDFHKVSLAAGMVFSYGWLLPLLIWSGLRYKSSKPPLSLLDLTCLYGYSLSVLVPVCLVWTAPIVWLRWCVGIVGVVLSGVVLAKAVWEGLKGGGQGGDFVEETGDDSAMSGGAMKKIAIAVVLIVVVMHVAIAMGFMLYFFSEPAGGSSQQLSPLALTAAPALPGDANARPTAPPSAAAKDIVPTKRDLTRASSLNPSGACGGCGGSGGGGSSNKDSDKPQDPDAVALKQILGSQPDLANLNVARKVPVRGAEPESNIAVQKDTAPVPENVSATPVKTDKPVPEIPKANKASESKADGSEGRFQPVETNVISGDTDARMDDPKIDAAAKEGSQVAANLPVVSTDKKERQSRSLHRTHLKTNT